MLRRDYRRQRGSREQGRKEGIQEARITMTRNFMRNNFSLEIIMESIGGLIC